MLTGDRIFGKSGTEYVIIKPLGKPGLFGQAFVCEAQGEAQKEKAVVKTLRPERSANPEDRDRFFAEARTLEAVAAVEERNTVHYAVRLLDESTPDATEPFIILEQATGKNVLNDLIEGVVDWDYAPLPETLALDIASHFARALSHTHQAGYCYDDMKLDNLFWRADQPRDPLRIIDWNVTSPVAERGVASDWKRFAARLYELYTGQHITISREGLVMGDGPGGPRWQRLPAGIRDIIEKGLAGHYQNDDTMLRDVMREREESRMDWEALLDKATTANGNNLIIEVLAPVSRAEPQIVALDPGDPKRKPALDQCAELREQAGARRGQASDKQIASAIEIMRGGNAPVASEQFKNVYLAVRSQDPRPRRWLWLARLAIDTPDVYREHRDNLEKAVEALNKGDIKGARTHLALLPSNLMLQSEFLIYDYIQKDQLDEALKLFDKLRHLFTEYPDLEKSKQELEKKRTTREQQQQAEKREDRFWDKIKTEVDRAKDARKGGNSDTEVQSLEAALGETTALLRAGCRKEQEARKTQEGITTWLTLARSLNDLEKTMQEARLYAKKKDRVSLEESGKRAWQALQIIEALGKLEVSGEILEGDVSQEHLKRIKEDSKNHASKLKEEANTIINESNLEQRIVAGFEESSQQVNILRQEINKRFDTLEQQLDKRFTILEQRLVEGEKPSPQKELDAELDAMRTRMLEQKGEGRNFSTISESLPDETRLDEIRKSLATMPEGEDKQTLQKTLKQVTDLRDALEEFMRSVTRADMLRHNISKHIGEVKKIVEAIKPGSWEEGHPLHDALLSHLRGKVELAGKGGGRKNAVETIKHLLPTAQRDGIFTFTPRRQIGQTLAVDEAIQSMKEKQYGAAFDKLIRSRSFVSESEEWRRFEEDASKTPLQEMLIPVGIGAGIGVPLLVLLIGLLLWFQHEPPVANGSATPTGSPTGMGGEGSATVSVPPPVEIPSPTATSTPPSPTANPTPPGAPTVISVIVGDTQDNKIPMPDLEHTTLNIELSHPLPEDMAVELVSDTLRLPLNIPMSQETRVQETIPITDETTKNIAAILPTPVANEPANLVFPLHIDGKDTGQVVQVFAYQRAVSGVALIDYAEYPEDFPEQGNNNRSPKIWQDIEQTDDVPVTTGVVLLSQNDLVQILDEQGEHYYTRVVTNTLDPVEAVGKTGWVRKWYIDGPQVTGLEPQEMTLAQFAGGEPITITTDAVLAEGVQFDLRPEGWQQDRLGPIIGVVDAPESEETTAPTLTRKANYEEAVRDVVEKLLFEDNPEQSLTLCLWIKRDVEPTVEAYPSDKCLTITPEKTAVNGITEENREGNDADFASTDPTVLSVYLWNDTKQSAKVTLGEGDTATEVTLKQGDMVFILQAKGEHYRIRKEEGGATGWVKKQYVDGVGGNQSGG